MKVTAHISENELVIGVSMEVEIDGEVLELYSNSKVELHGIKKRRSQENSSAAIASLALRDMTRKLHRAVLPQLREGVAEAMAQVVPPVDDAGEDGGSATRAAM